MDLNHVRQLMRSLYWSTWEREYQQATARTRSPWGNYSQTIMESKWKRRGRWRWLRGSIPVTAGCRNRTFWLPKRSFVAAEHGDVFGSFVNCVRVYSAGAIYGPKGSFRRSPRQPHVASARVRVFLAEPTCRACTGRIRTRMEMNLLYKTCGGKFPGNFATRLFPFDVVFRPERDDLWK